jgi:hypothetical protein
MKTLGILILGLPLMLLLSSYICAWVKDLSPNKHVGGLFFLLYLAWIGVTLILLNL